MKKLLRSVLFLVILLVLLVVTSALFLPKDNTLKAGVDERDEGALSIFAEEPDSIDAVILGDSESSTGLSPLKLWDEYGIASYTCGQTAQRMPEAYYMLKRALKVQKPKLVILETNLLFWPDNKKDSIKKAIYEAASYYLPVLRYHNQWKNLNAGNLKLPEYKNKLPLKGMDFKTETVPYNGTEYMHKTGTQQKLAMIEAYYLKKMIALCERNRMELFLVSIPSPRNWNYERHNTITAFAEKNGIRFADLNLLRDEIGLVWEEDSLDGGDHLNVYGAEKATSYVGAFLKEHYQLPDHRGDENYASWDADYKNYRKDVDSRREQGRADEKK